jgi:hypothetical protein
MSQQLDLNTLLQKPMEQRDEKWEDAFLQAFPLSTLRILEEVPQEGPDGFPYLIVATDDTGTEPAAKVLDWLSARGIGLVVNPLRDMPDYVFTFGQIWNFKERGQFNSPVARQNLGQFKLDEGQKVLAGAPTEEHLPQYVREILRSFFSQVGAPSVKILMLSTDRKHYDLCFSIESLGNPEKHEHPGVLEAISWFLPSHYSIALIHEKGLPPFHPL